MFQSFLRCDFADSIEDADIGKNLSDVLDSTNRILIGKMLNELQDYLAAPASLFLRLFGFLDVFIG